MIEQQDSASNSMDSVPAAAMEIAPQPAPTTTAEAQKVVKGRFDEQIALMPDTIQIPVLKQLDLVPQEYIYKIVDTHNGASILYKTYDQAKEANVRKDSIANAQGITVVPHAKAKLGSTYYTGKGDETATFGVGSLVEFQISGLLIVMLALTGLCILCYGTSALFKILGLGKIESKKPVLPQSQAAAPVGAVMPATEIHPGLSNEKLAVIFAVAAAEILGRPCTVVRFRPQNTNDWVWAIQGRTELHSNGLK